MKEEYDIEPEIDQDLVIDEIKPRRLRSIIRLLSKLAPADKVQGVSGTENRSVHEVREDLSTGTTRQFADGVEFGKKSIILILAVGSVVGIILLTGYIYQQKTEYVSLEALPVIKAESQPYKIKPEDPGGLRVPNQDKSVYENLSLESLPKVEKILPPPEEPIEIAKSAEHSAREEAAEEDNNKKGSSLETTTSKTIEHLIVNRAVSEEEIEEKKGEKTLNNTASSTVSEEQISKEAVADHSSHKKIEPVIQKELPVPAEPNSSHYRVQLGAFKTEKAAKEQWSRLEKKLPNQVTGFHSSIEKKEIKDKGMFYRLQAGPFKNSTAAKQWCKLLINEQLGCFIIYVK